MQQPLPGSDPLTTFKIRSGPEIYTAPNSNLPLISGVLWEEDVVMLLGSEKAGKSILAIQMAAALTSGGTFLDKYAVSRPCDVLYIQTEGKESDVSDRLNCMRHALEVDDTRFHHIFKRYIMFDLPEVVEGLIRAIDAKGIHPCVIFLDSLYTSMLGDLNENKDTRKFIAIFSRVLERYHCALVIIHHEGKEWHIEGKAVDRGDHGSYGSVFWRAWVSHILYLKKLKDKSRSFGSDTQRTGQILQHEDLILLEPDPLCFQIKGEYAAYIEVVRATLRRFPAGILREELISTCGLSASAVDKAIRELTKLGEIEKTLQKPRKYIPLIGLDAK